jgi:glycosyltransferase involved in cell wall biosynthesis
VKILSVGRFAAQKDYLTALNAIVLLKKKAFDKTIEYIIVGDGELDQQIQTWIKDLQVSDVTIVRNPDKIEDYYIESDIYFLSSIFEGTPNSIMEALNYSLPVVSTDVGDAKYLVKDGLNGFLVPVRDSGMLASKLYELVSDPDKRNEFGKNGHSLLIKEFSEERFRDEYINFTKKIL